MKLETEELLKKAIEELNEQLEDAEQLKYDPELHLIGSKAAMDSMTLVTFIAIIEDLLLDEYDKDIHLVTNSAFSREHSPFYKIETLGQYIEELIAEEN